LNAIFGEESEAANEKPYTSTVDEDVLGTLPCPVLTCKMAIGMRTHSEKFLKQLRLFMELTVTETDASF
jgi:hypothetical protein